MDIITLNKIDGTTEKVEIVICFKLENISKNNDYVFYKSNNKYFGARYIEKDGNTNLITDLSNEEKVALSNIFDKLRKAGVIKC